MQLIRVSLSASRLAELLDLADSGVHEVRVAEQAPLTEASSASEKVAGGGRRAAGGAVGGC